MDLNLLLDMVVSGYGDRTAVVDGGRSLTYADLGTAAAAGAGLVRAAGADAFTYVAPNHLAFPVGLFSAAAAGVPFIPLNYRLSEDQLAPLAGQHADSVVVAEQVPVPGTRVERAYLPDAFLEAVAGGAESEPSSAGPDDVAVLLYTSGTTGTPKAAILRHRHLTAYVFGTVEFGGAGEDEAALVTVPPYHIAGLANLLSNLYAGRRIVYLDTFEPDRWLATVREEGVTQAMVVPTMLARLVRHLAGRPADVPTLRTLSYGGSRMPLPVLEEALLCFPSTGFVNAYGLTETSSTIALLGPEDHRAAFESEDPAARARLTSVGRTLPGVEVEVRDEAGEVLGTGEAGEVFLRGEQVSGEYEGSSVLDEEGWFPTRDRGWVDEEGYLFIEGRADDTIIRGGENIAPAEIEDVLVKHPGVHDVAVVGLPDEEWGQRIAAVVCVEGEGLSAEELRDWARQHLRSSKTPDVVEFWAELPRTHTGKLLRREVLATLTTERPADQGD
ncbi:MAG TPA: fatty acid--CoA ligase family protein [Acidimicrobiales bacterium]|nr:fatty acid--CoA ligase family protein [Acidimicrobiales bacterium]